MGKDNNTCSGASAELFGYANDLRHAVGKIQLWKGIERYEEVPIELAMY
jgi:hypothetical protein